MFSIGLKVCRAYRSICLQSARYVNEGGTHSVPLGHPGYEGDGKTTVSVLNTEEMEQIMIDTYSEAGFRLSNGVFIIGPIAVFPRNVFQWDITSLEEITPESLTLFCILEPKIDILVIGTGDDTLKLSRPVVDCLRKHKIGFEVLQTSQAIPTFNYLNSDHRNVAAALFPPMRKADDVDMIDNRLATAAKRGILFAPGRAAERVFEKSVHDDIISHAKRDQMEKTLEELKKIHKSKTDP